MLRWPARLGLLSAAATRGSDDNNRGTLIFLHVVGQTDVDVERLPHVSC